VRAVPRKLALYQPVMVPWQTPPQSNDFFGRSRARATRRANAGRLVSVSTPCNGWWKLTIQPGLTARRNFIMALVSGSEPGLGPDS
jgi:hypothetical protein